MSFLDDNLLEGEKILYRTKKHYIIFLAPFLWTLAIFFCLINSNPFIQKAAILPAIIALFYWINCYLIYITAEFAVTNIRLMMREGFFIRHSDETRLTTIARVSVNQSLIGQFLNYGIVFINPFGGEADSFRDVANPMEFQKRVQEQLTKITRTI